MRIRKANQAAYRRLKPMIDSSYPAGRFIAIAAGQVVADAESLPSLHDRLKANNKDSRPGTRRNQ